MMAALGFTVSSYEEPSFCKGLWKDVAVVEYVISVFVDGVYTQQNKVLSKTN